MLLTSSLFVALGTSAARAGRTAESLRLFGIALACGAAFPVLKLFEYVPEIIAGVTPGTNLFFMFYFVMTGLHLCHVMLGLVILSFVIRSLRRLAEPRHAVRRNRCHLLAHGRRALAHSVRVVLLDEVNP